jgi:hypothetical protein
MSVAKWRNGVTWQRNQWRQWLILAMVMAIIGENIG